MAVIPSLNRETKFYSFHMQLIHWFLVGNSKLPIVFNEVKKRGQDEIDFFLRCLAAKRETNERVGFIIASAHRGEDM